MGGDYSRMTFKPLRDYSGVMKQQGRVGLDADHNELVEITDRRWRSESIDIMGRDVVPISNPENMTAFEIDVGGTSFTIGRGRMYVDGLQIECHGDLASVEYDASLGEERGQNPLAYEDQPYFRNPPAPSTSGSGLTDLVYVDAWDREVTAVEDPAIREIALGGPDTATRTQTAWQVRVMPNVSATACSDDIAAWNQLIAPPTGRLSTQAVQPPASDDPCVLSPTGGYRGLENRLYRVEIHDVNAAGQARFKWARDDASILTTVETINGNQLTVRRIGRDAVLRFRIGDWVELMDDPTELGIDPTTLEPLVGFTAQVTNIDEANRIVTLSAAPPPTFNATIADNHTRLRRWDQSFAVDANGLLPVTIGVWIPIEDGIQIQFGPQPPQNATFKARDYWVFAARTADGSVEGLDQAPPHGIVHHYARLALVTWSNPPEVSDCRVLWPQEGCCTEVVWPGEDIQAAIDRLAKTGGCVCLKAGVHEVRQMITIPYPNICMHGESIAAVVRGTGSPALLAIRAPDVSIHDIRFEMFGGSDSVSIIAVLGGTNTAIHDCELAAMVKQYGRTTIAAITILGGGATAIARNQMMDVTVGVTAMRSGRVHLIDNGISAYIASMGAGPTPVGIAGFIAESVLQPCRVESNTIDGFAIGLYLARYSTGSIVARNRITRQPGWTPSPSVLQSLMPDLVIPTALYAIDCAAELTIVSDNVMNVPNEEYGGIHVTAPRVRVEGNLVGCEMKTWVTPGPTAIYLEAPTDLSSVSECIVRGNQLVGPQLGIGVNAESIIGAAHIEILDNIYRAPPAGPGPLAAGIRCLEMCLSRVERNDLQGGYIGIAIAGRMPAPGNVVHDNRLLQQTIGVGIMTQSAPRISDNAIAESEFALMIAMCTRSQISGNSIGGVEVGIFTANGTSTTIRGNTVTDAVEGIAASVESNLVVDGNRVENASAGGILTANVAGAALRHNYVANCAYVVPQNGVTNMASIQQTSTTATATVESCDVVGTGVKPDGSLSAGITHAILQAGVTNARVRSNRVDNPAGIGPARFAISLVLGRNAEIVDNAIIGSGSVPLIWVRQVSLFPFVLRFSDVICSGNRCSQTVLLPSGGPPPPTASILIASTRLAAVGNVVRASNPAFASFRTADNMTISAMGNVTSGLWVAGVANNFGPLPITSTNQIHV